MLQAVIPPNALLAQERACRYVLCYDRPCGDYRAVANRNAFQNGAVCADPNIVPNQNRFAAQLSGVLQIVIVIVPTTQARIAFMRVFLK